MFGILGVTRVLGADGAEVALGGPRRRALLALLLLDAGRVVTTERLIDGLYGEDPPAGVGNAVQSQVSRLRQVLPAALEGHPAGYRLAVDADLVDAHRFARLAAEGRHALAAGDAAGAATRLREALALWRGPALADVGEAPFATAQAARLEELRTAAAEDRVDADLVLGRHRQLVAELGELVAAHPSRERLRGQLMRALYGSGRQSEALEAYESARRELAESLGADPGPELAAVHLAVLRGDPALLPAGPPGLSAVHVSRETSPAGTPGTAGSASPGPAAPAAPAAPVSVSDRSGPHHELPARFTSFVGREAELASVETQLTHSRLVTLTGPGGAGKTRLAVEAAARHPHDATFVDLSGITGGAQLPRAVLAALGLRDGGLVHGGTGGAAAQSGAAGPDPVAWIATALEGRPALLLLDNCEHVVEDAARFAERLLSAAPRLRILATSREALGIGAETLCPIPTLPLPQPGADALRSLTLPAPRLFTERAAAVRPDFDPAADTATAEAVLRLCTALDGLPLAIELAAARLRSMSVTDIADRLVGVPADDVPYSLGVRPDALFRLLSRGSRTAQPRQRTLRGVVDWSWELLPDDERAVLRRASVFAGGWTLAAAEVVCADPHDGDAPGAGIEPEDVLDLMAALVEKSLVVAEQPDGGGRVRYRMLESIRAYGAERLDEAAESATAQRAHTAWFLDFALTADPHLRRAEQLDWLRLLADDRDNLQAALHRSLEAADIRTAMRLISALSSYWLLRGVRYEGVGPARQVLAALGPNPPQGMAEEYALCVMAVVGTLSGTEGFAEHVAAATRLVDGMKRVSRRFPVLTLVWAPFAGVPDGDMNTLEVLEEFLAEEDDPWYRALTHLGAGYQAWVVAADADQARRESGLALDGFRRVGDRWGMITSLNVLADLADHRGEIREAAELLGRALVLAEELDSAIDIAELLCNRAAYSRQAGAIDAAAASCERAAELARRAGAPEALALAHLGLAESARLGGELAAARELAAQALAECPAGWFSSAGTRAAVLVSLARIEVAAGDRDAARAWFAQAVTADGVVLRFPLAGASAAEAAAGLALLEGDPRAAAVLLGVAQALRGSPPGGPDVSRTEAAVGAALGGAEAAAVRNSGAGLDRDAAIATLTAFAVGP
jgi:predicted ATPase/DNA-binding SARP family transcriptional activator